MPVSAFATPEMLNQIARHQGVDVLADTTHNRRVSSGFFKAIAVCSNLSPTQQKNCNELAASFGIDFPSLQETLGPFRERAGALLLEIAGELGLSVPGKKTNKSVLTQLLPMIKSVILLQSWRNGRAQYDEEKLVKCFGDFLAVVNSKEDKTRFCSEYNATVETDGVHVARTTLLEAVGEVLRKLPEFELPTTFLAVFLKIKPSPVYRKTCKLDLFTLAVLELIQMVQQDTAAEDFQTNGCLSKALCIMFPAAAKDASVSRSRTATPKKRKNPEAITGHSAKKAHVSQSSSDGKREKLEKTEEESASRSSKQRKTPRASQSSSDGKREKRETPSRGSQSSSSGGSVVQCKREKIEEVDASSMEVRADEDSADEDSADEDSAASGFESDD